MKNVLFICNTPYQIFVCTWLAHTYYKECCVDIVISNHMSDSQKLVENARKANVFGTVYHVESKEFVFSASKDKHISHFERLKNKYSLARKVFHMAKLFNDIYNLWLSDKKLKKYINLEKKYDVVCCANLDKFTQLLFSTISNSLSSGCRNSKVELYVFEDGISTYSKLFKKYMQGNIYSVATRFLPFKPKVSAHSIQAMHLFEPDAVLWEADIPIIPIEKINVNNIDFKDCINVIFDYENMSDDYNKRYIFMEESFFSEGYTNINDIDIVNKIASYVGKDNIMVKIHPRNPMNRFKELGYKTNINTSVPWEVIVINQDLSSKVLLTIASSSVINPIRLFDLNIKAFSLYSLLNVVPNVLSGDLWEAVKDSYLRYDYAVQILNNEEELIKIKDEGEDINESCGYSSNEIK